ncbi:hypothetical protein SAMD00023353_5400160 [Rosellinia necatrix]|uniref:Uncharacterized protein n=1 Tax=Rosellinia necatrix TaxID=77044 RepID=A0A1S8A9X7_ROSNE|nr:hypothetical protein SAMD00023353_5400160 [Rosellinia necatrix]
MSSVSEIYRLIDGEIGEYYSFGTGSWAILFYSFFCHWHGTIQIYRHAEHGSFWIKGTLLGVGSRVRARDEEIASLPYNQNIHLVVHSTFNIAAGGCSVAPEAHMRAG